MKIIGPKYITKHFYTKRYKTAFKLMQISKKNPSKKSLIHGRSASFKGTGI